MPWGGTSPQKQGGCQRKGAHPPSAILSAWLSEAPFTYTFVVGLLFPVSGRGTVRAKGSLEPFHQVIKLQMAHRSTFPAAVDESVHSFTLCYGDGLDETSLLAQLEFFRSEVKVFPHGMYLYTAWLFLFLLI